MLTAIIHTKNSEKTVKRALESVKWADEIVVVDMKSQDKTVEIVKKYTDRVFEFKDVGYVEPARNFALSKAKGDWIFILDADEEVPLSLVKKIKEICENSSADAYFIPRKNIIFEKWMEYSGWWPDYQLRLFKKGKVSWQEEIHSIPEVSGLIEHFPKEEQLAIIHHNYQSVSQFIQRLDRYSSIQAKELGAKKITAVDVISTFSDEFLRRMFEWEASKDGTHGVALAFFQSFSELAKLLKEWEEKDFQSSNVSQEEIMMTLAKFHTDLGYWLADWKVKNSKGMEHVKWRVKRKLR